MSRGHWVRFEKRELTLVEIHEEKFPIHYLILRTSQTLSYLKNFPNIISSQEIPKHYLTMRNSQTLSYHEKFPNR